MSESEQIAQATQQLVSAPVGLSLLDGLLIGAVIGAAGATLLVLGRVLATRQIRRRLGPATAPASFKPGAGTSPL